MKDSEPSKKTLLKLEGIAESIKSNERALMEVHNILAGIAEREPDADAGWLSNKVFHASILCDIQDELIDQVVEYYKDWTGNKTDGEKWEAPMQR